MGKYLLTLQTLIIWFSHANRLTESQTLKTYFLDLIIENTSEGDICSKSIDEGPQPTPSLQNPTPSRCNDNNSFQENCRAKPCCSIPSNTIDTMNVYQNFDFEKKYNHTSLFWTEELENRFRESLTSPKRLPLKVFIVPFSHNDAGWVKTFQEYYEEKTKHVLDKIISKLQQLDDMTFVWSEISFLAEWWKSTDMQARSDFLDLIKTGRLEILTGGWVMPDEATTHYFALLTQLTEGHQWLQDNLGIKPKTGWSIDPFGHSATMPYLLKLSGITDGTIIQRVHYNWKSYFARERAGDFLWRQRWDVNGDNDLLTHHQPFEIYSAVRSCGPHREVCQEYDFNFVTNLTRIRFKNVKERLEILLSEYGRTGSLFEHNVILVTLGDDFRFVEDSEWNDQYNNYKALIDYLSSIESYNTDIQFGTPKDYFKEIYKRQKIFSNKKFPILKGDFFPYSDLDKIGAVYWTGFYSTRPYWKSLSRKTEANLRSAEILYTITLNYMKQNNLNYRSLICLYRKLITARQLLSVFQHHDGITGTSKHYVMNDYLNMLLESNINSLAIQSRSIQSILFDKNVKGKPIKMSAIPTLLIPTTIFASINNNQLNIEIKIIDRYPRTIVVFNPLASWREDVIRLTISSPIIVIKDSKNRIVNHQINPIWRTKSDKKTNDDNDNGDDEGKLKLNMSNSKYEVIFIVEIPALTLKIFTIEVKKNCMNKFNDTIYKTKITTKNDTYDTSDDTNPLFKFDKFDNNDITMSNKYLRIKIDPKTGYLKKIFNRKNNSMTLNCKQSYRMYNSMRHRSGAYIFKPEHDEINLNFKNIYMVMITGKITTELIVMFDEMITQIYKLYNTDGPLSRIIHIESLIDIRKSTNNLNVELVIRFKTNIDNGNPRVFYTDSNGYQMQKRVIVPGIGIEGNYYPITTSIYIEDNVNRFTVLTKQSHGATSNCKGSIEIMMDRRIDSDDSKGMGEGVLDNELTSLNFWLLMEDIIEDKLQPKSDVPKSSLLSDYLSDSFIYSTNVFVSNFFIYPTFFTNELRLISKPLPCGVHLVNLRTLTHPSIDRYPLSTALVTVQRKGSFTLNANENEPKQANKCNQFNEQYLKCKPIIQKSSQVFQDNTSFINITIVTIKPVSLTGLKEKNKIPDLSVYELEPFEMGSIKINFN